MITSIYQVDISLKMHTILALQCKLCMEAGMAFTSMRISCICKDWQDVLMKIYNFPATTLLHAFDALLRIVS